MTATPGYNLDASISRQSIPTFSVPVFRLDCIDIVLVMKYNSKVFLKEQDRGGS